MVSEVTPYRGKGKVAELLETARMRGLNPTDVEVLHRPEVYGRSGRRRPRAVANRAHTPTRPS
ncbi:MAG: hypothetical protein ABJA74_13950 [Lapillicoccus sp.]